MKVLHMHGPPYKKMKVSKNLDRKKDVSTSFEYHKLCEARRKLPIYPVQNRLVQEVRRLNTVIVIGETGSGKTTQIPQFLFRAEVHRGSQIAITQPRRVAAVTVAKRVAQEMKSELGKLVGYCVRFEDVTSESTRIKYMTDGMLLREAIIDPLMRRYSVVILDEAHERTIHTDVLFGVVKAAQRQRAKKGLKPLKIVVMSATMDVDHFSEYFNSAPVLYLEGRQFPVNVYYSCCTQSDYQFAALVTLGQIHKQAPPNHDVLMFLTGQDEIESMVRFVRDIGRSLEGQAPPIIACPLYAALPPQVQLRVFNRTPPGARKVVIATNIAETSVTIPGIKFVIDPGMVKARVFNPRSGLDLLKVVRISKAQALQRTGRAGRESSGSCYRLYTEQEFDSFKLNTVPEIQKGDLNIKRMCSLSSVVLQLMALGISDLIHFDFMDRPSKESIITAVDELHLLGAVEKREKIQLTALGKQMAAFPLEPRLSKVILVAKEFSCLEEIMSIVSLLSGESVFYTPHKAREEALAARRKFMSTEGDHISLLNIYKTYKSVGGNKNWCMENYIHQRNMKTALDVRNQLREICDRQNLPFKSCRDDTVAIRKCLTAGFFMNAAELQREGTYICLSTRRPVSIHPSSSLFRSKPGYVLYNELIQTSKCYMRDLCVVDPDWLYEAAPSHFKRKKLPT
ncbi:hypothetical protein ScPMuIL_012615 [Solemya velum]